MKVGILDSNSDFAFKIREGSNNTEWGKFNLDRWHDPKINLNNVTIFRMPTNRKWSLWSYVQIPYYVLVHSLITGFFIQSCSTGAKNFTNYVFCHPQFSGVIKDLFYRWQNVSNSTLYPDVWKQKQQLLLNKIFQKCHFFYLRIHIWLLCGSDILAAVWPDDGFENL